MEGIGAVLVIGHFVISIFNVPLGNPVIYSLPFSDMKTCEQYAEYLPPEPIKLNIEWNHSTKSQCMTTGQFKKIMEARGVQKPATCTPEK